MTQTYRSYQQRACITPTASTSSKLILLALVLLLGGIFASSAEAQGVRFDVSGSDRDTRAAVDSRAQVITQIVIESLSDLILDNEDGNIETVIIDPRSDVNASIIRVEGQRGLQIRINFPEEEELSPIDTSDGRIKLRYLVSWNTVQDQRGSTELVTQNDELRIGQDGILYLWMGGEVDISQAREGTYLGNFFLEVEYL